MKNLLFVLFVSLNLISCTTTKCSIGPSIKKVFDFHTENILPIKSFVKLQSLVDITGAEEDGLVPFSSASGFFIAENKIFTAAHFCHSYTLIQFFAERGDVVNGVYFMMNSFDGNKREVVPLKVDEKNDLCIMQIIGPTDEIDKTIISIADHRPRIGEKVYNIAAPLGIFAPGMVPIFEGFYGGGAIGGPSTDDQPVDLYTIPIKQGSSGSPIVNCDGDLIGIVMSGVHGFPNLGFSPRYEIIKEFLK